MSTHNHTHTDIRFEYFRSKKVVCKEKKHCKKDAKIDAMNHKCMMD